MKILQIAGFGNKFGSGHFVRQKILQKILNELGFNSEIVKINNIKEILKLDLIEYDLIIKDTRNSNETTDIFFGSKLVIDFDDYYLSKRYRGYRFYWNSIPSLVDFGNLKSLKYLIINDFENKNQINDGNSVYYDIFISFGNLDPYNCTKKIANFINQNNQLFSGKKILFVLPEKIYDNIIKNKENSIYSNFDILRAGDEKYKFLVSASNTIITHFGLFVFEILKMNKNLIIFSPTSYHEKLSNKYFKNLHISKKGKIVKEKFLSLILNDTNDQSIKKINYEKDNYFYDNFNSFNLSDLGNIFEIKEKLTSLLNYIKDNKENFIKKCPICESKTIKTLYLYEKFNLLICPYCKTIIKENLDYEQMNEDEKEKYYIDEYKNLYGKTYFEDRENIKKINLDRINYILPHLLKSTSQKISAIDFGGALGFFLDDLKEKLSFLSKRMEGYIVESNTYALEFCMKKGYFSYKSIDDIEQKEFDIISFWFCFEHIKDFDHIVNRAFNLLKKGGILCLSFPSQFGPMFCFKKNRTAYFETRPKDHFYDFNPYSLKKYFIKKGFNIYRVRIPSFHYERFKNALPFISTIFNKIFIKNLSNAIKFGDICELYAIKK